MAGVASRFGNSSGEWDLFLKEYGGFTLAAFLEKTVMADKVRTRQIRGAKSATFPRIGTATAAYHTVGQNLLEDGSYESEPHRGEQVVNVDNLLISTVLINDIDEALSFYDVRQPYARNQAHALARELDLDLMKVCVSGSADTAVTGWDKAGIQLTDADFESGTAANALATIREAAKSMDLNHVPQEGRHMILGPTAFHSLRSDATVASTDYNTNTGGDVGLGTWLQYSGFKIHMSPLIEDSTATTGFRINHTEVTAKNNADYIVNCSNVLSIFFQEDAIGHVRAMDLSVEGEYHQLYQGTVMTARMACGSAVLRQAACGHIKSS